MSTNDYNNEPIYYCKRCLSLRVMRLFDTSDTCYCDECGSTEIESAHVTAWLLMKEAKEGFKIKKY